MRKSKLYMEPPVDPLNLTRGARVRAVTATFRNILLVLFLIFIFTVAQTFMLWRVCNAGMKTATSLEEQGLPTLNTLASLQEHLALYRLNSYEYLFAKEGERAEKAKAAEAMAAKTRAELKAIQTLLPEAAGQRLVSDLEAAMDDLDREFGKVRGLVDSDFAAAMKEMDQNIPPRIESVAGAARALKAYGYDASSRQASATFESFGWIKKEASVFGAANIFVAFGVVVFVLLAARGTSNRLSETMARLEESEETFRALFETSLDALTITDENGFLDCNGAALRLFGCESKEELTSKHPADFSPPYQADGRDSLTAALDRIGTAATKGGVFFEWMHRRQDGTVFPTEVQLCSFKLKGKTVSHAVVRDVTERKRAEEALRESEARFRTICETSPLGIYMMDENHDLVYANRAACEITGRSCEELAGQGWKEAVHPEDHETVDQQWGEMERGRYPSRPYAGICTGREKSSGPRYLARRSRMTSRSVNSSA
jgi:PAS domain S-box-containing protein